MKTRWMLLAAMAMIGSLALSTARAAAGPGGGPLQHILELAKELNLTDDQKTKIDALSKEIGSKFDPGAMREKAKTNPELRDLLKEMRTAREAGDEAKLKELRQKLVAMNGGAAGGGAAAGPAGGGGRGEIMTKLAAILTPDQLKKLRELREANGGGPGGGGRGGNSQGSTPDPKSKPDASKGVPNPFD